MLHKMDGEVAKLWSNLISPQSFNTPSSVLEKSKKKVIINADCLGCLIKTTVLADEIEI